MVYLSEAVESHRRTYQQGRETIKIDKEETVGKGYNAMQP